MAQAVTGPRPGAIGGSRSTLEAGDMLLSRSSSFDYADLHWTHVLVTGSPDSDNDGGLHLVDVVGLPFGRSIIGAFHSSRTTGWTVL